MKKWISVLAVLLCVGVAQAEEPSAPGNIWSITTIQKIRGGANNGEMWIEQGAVYKVAEYNGARFYIRGSASRNNEEQPTSFSSGGIVVVPIRGLENWLDFGFEVAGTNHLSVSESGQTEWGGMVSPFVNFHLHEIMHIQLGVRLFQDTWGEFMNRASYGGNIAIDAEKLAGLF